MGKTSLKYERRSIEKGEIQILVKNFLIGSLFANHNHVNKISLITKITKNFEFPPFLLTPSHIVRNDGTPNRKKYLGILLTSERKINSLIQEEYDLHTDEYVNCIKKVYNKNIAQKYIKEYLAKWAIGYKECDYYHPSIWVEKKKYQ